MIAVVLAIAWMFKAEKVSCVQIAGFVAFVGILAVDILFAANIFDAVWTTYGMFTLLLGICIPLITFTDTLAKFRVLMNGILGIFLYIALYAILNAGFGPAGTAGGQDENYVAAAMSLAIPIAWFSFYAETAIWKKIWFACLVCLYMLAIVVGLSRGGFLGLLCAAGYSVLKSPKRWLAIALALILGGGLIVVAGSSYWDEMSTITDTSEATADLRLELWEIATKEFLAYPLTGVGGGNYHWRMSEFQSPEQMAKFDRILAAEVHSTYFQLLAETGLAGCVVFCVILLRTYQDYRHVDSLAGSASGHLQDPEGEIVRKDFEWIQSYGRGLMGGIIGYSVSVAFVSALYYSHLWIAVSLMAALHMITIRKVTGQTCRLLG